MLTRRPSANLRAPERRCAAPRTAGEGIVGTPAGHKPSAQGRTGSSGLVTATGKRPQFAQKLGARRRACPRARGVDLGIAFVDEPPGNPNRRDQARQRVDGIGEVGKPPCGLARRGDERQATVATRAGSSRARRGSGRKKAVAAVRPAERTGSNSPARGRGIGGVEGGIGNEASPGGRGGGWGRPTTERCRADGGRKGGKKKQKTKKKGGTMGKQVKRNRGGKQKKKQKKERKQTVQKARKKKKKKRNKKKKKKTPTTQKKTKKKKNK